MPFKYYRTEEKQNRYKSLDFTLNNDLNEDFHEVRYFDDFLDNIYAILNDNQQNTYFYSGWNYKPIKELINGRYKKYGICTNENNETVNIPIYISLYNKNDKSYASVNRKSNIIVISLNVHNLNKDILKYELKHEFTHVVCDYSEENYANLDNLKNTIAYDENVFNINQASFDIIERYLYWINKSEQNARISVTLMYIREHRQQKNETTLSYDQIINYIKETYVLNQLDLFKNDIDNMNKLNNDEIYIIGYYMQMHHYLYSNLFKDVVSKAIKTNVYDEDKLNEIKNAYYYGFKDYREKIFNYIKDIKI